MYKWNEWQQYKKGLEGGIPYTLSYWHYLQISIMLFEREFKLILNVISRTTTEDLNFLKSITDMLTSKRK